jgi:hypothetical protein
MARMSSRETPEPATDLWSFREDARAGARPRVLYLPRTAGPAASAKAARDAIVVN